MIHVIVEYHENSIKYLEVSGHADFAQKGQDIVCAGVSSLVMSNLMYAEKHHLGVFEATEVAGHVMVNVEESSASLDHLLAAIVEGITSMKEQYPEYIEIVKR